MKSTPDYRHTTAHAPLGEKSFGWLYLMKNRTGKHLRQIIKPHEL